MNIYEKIIKTIEICINKYYIYIYINIAGGPRAPHIWGAQGPPFSEKKNSRPSANFFSAQGPRAPQKIMGPGPHFLIRGLWAPFFSGGLGGLCPPVKTLNYFFSGGPLPPWENIKL